MKGYQYRGAFNANMKVNAEPDEIKKLKKENEELKGKLAVSNSALNKKNKEVEYWQNRHDEVLDERDELEEELVKAKKVIKNAPAVVDAKKAEKRIFAVYAKELAKKDADLAKKDAIIKLLMKQKQELIDMLVNN